MKRQRKGPVWNAGAVRKLRSHLGLTQRELAEELGTRQQTISDWETGAYTPRGTSRRLLALIAERAGFAYKVEGEVADTEAEENRDPQSLDSAF